MNSHLYKLDHLLKKMIVMNKVLSSLIIVLSCSVIAPSVKEEDNRINKNVSLIESLGTNGEGISGDSLQIERFLRIVKV